MKKIAQIRCDVNEFLRKTRRKIKKLPEEYRNMLMEVYKRVANRIHIELERSLVYIK